MATENTEKGFDLRVTHRDPKTGLIVAETPYVLRVLASGDGGKTQLWERPKHSGNLFEKSGKPCGRWIVDPKTKIGRHDPSAEHIAYIPPETQDQKLARSLNEKDARIAALESELLSIKKDSTSTAAKVEKKDKGV